MCNFALSSYLHFSQLNEYTGFPYTDIPLDYRTGIPYNGQCTR